MSPDRRSALTMLGGAMLAGHRGPAAFATQSAPRVRRDLYNCEGCEAVGERVPVSLSAIAVLAGPGEPGTRLLLTGIVRSPDTLRPAAGVVIYAHHTNAQGYYADGNPETLWSRRHGRLRGWARTDRDGRYGFRTIRPAPYPDRTMPAHIHLFVGEPGRRPYYIDDVVFEGAFGVTPHYIAAQELRGGSGIVAIARRADGTQLAVRDIILERHPAGA